MCCNNLSEFLNSSKTKQIDVAHGRPKMRRDFVSRPLIEVPLTHDETLPGIQIRDRLHERLAVRRLR